MVKLLEIFFSRVGKTLPSKARKIFFDLGPGPFLGRLTLSLGAILGAVEGAILGAVYRGLYRALVWGHLALLIRGLSTSPYYRHLKNKGPTPQSRPDPGYGDPLRKRA